MSREIKFRAWDKDSGNWVEGVTLLLHMSGRLIRLPPNIELTQGTGMLDKNGKEIFEGDIVRVVGYDRGEVAFGKAGFLARCTGGHLALLENMSSQWLEVIGNIYETSEILKEQA